MQQLLTDQELRFLLDASQPVVQAEAGGAEGEEQDRRTAPQASFSRDLQDIDLRDILTTMGRTGMEGVLVVANALEEHYLWVRRGSVSDWVPSRVESRRLGRRLIRAGTLTSQQVEEAVQRQQHEDRPLGQLLVDEGMITEEEIEETARCQALEDICSLFVWTDGTVEFEEGSPSSSQQELLAGMPVFDINEVLAEVQSREDEWRPILESLGSLNEIMVACGEGDTAQLDESHELVLKALDGKSSLLDLSHRTMLGLFDCASAVKDLYEWRMVDVAPTDELLSLARARVVQGEARRAVVLLRNLVKRRDLTELEDVLKVGELLGRCKENRQAGEYLVTAAHGRETSEEKLELARLAYRLDPRSSKVLAYLRDRLLESGAGDAELLPVCCALADEMIADGWLDEALEVVEAFVVRSSDDAAPLSRKVRILCKLGRNEEAADELTALAELCKAEGKHDRLAKIYEQILRIDGERRDIETALRRLERRRNRTFVPIVATVAGLVVVAVAWLLTRDSNIPDPRVLEWANRVNEQLETGALAEAQRLFEGSAEFALTPEAKVLRERIAALEARRREEREERFLSRLSEAADRLDERDVGQALSIYRELRSNRDYTARVRKIVDSRFESVENAFGELASALPSTIPEAPKPLDTEQEITAVLGQLDGSFDPGALTLARNVLRAGSDGILEEMLGAERAGRLQAQAQAVVALFDRAAARRRQYVDARERLVIRRRLEGLWTAVQTYEKQFAIAKCHEIYDRLAREYPDGKDGLRQVFEAKRDRYASLVRDMRDLDEATRRGDLQSATKLFEFLQRREPEIPFDRLVRLPVRITSSPASAKVLVGGVQVGQSPILAAYRPADEPVIRIELDGFEPFEHRITAVVGLAIDVVLTRAPQWLHRAKGVVERRAVFDGSGRVYVVDRSGRMTAFDRRSGDQLWLESTGDLSGLLPSPVLWRDQIIVMSLDGPVRCLERDTARTVWERPGFPCEAAPVIVGDTLYAATVERELVAFDLTAGGKIANRTALPGEVIADLQARGDRVFLTTSNGWLVCADASVARRGGLAWKVRAGSGINAAPCVTEGQVVVGTAEGKVVALNPSNGSRQWEAPLGHGEVLLRPLDVGSAIAVAVHDRLITLDRSNGARRRTFEGGASWAADPVLAGDSILVGDRNGVVVVLDAETLEVRYHLRGGSAVAGPVAVSDDGWLVVGFEDRSVHCYRR